MDIYALVKFLHIASAMIWIGGGFCLMVIALVADRRADDEGLLRVMQTVVMLGNTLFVPAALLTLLFGSVMVWMAWSVTDFWVMLALGGFATSFLLGSAVMKPHADRLTEAAAREGASPAVIARCRRIVQIAKFDYVILFMITAIMLLKPRPEDYLLLSIFAVVLAGAALLFLLPRRSVRLGSATDEAGL
ncbi:MAG: DUF2269 family protein [Gemmobacter sp.]